MKGIVLPFDWRQRAENDSGSRAPFMTVFSLIKYDVNPPADSKYDITQMLLMNLCSRGKRWSVFVAQRHFESNIQKLADNLKNVRAFSRLKVANCQLQIITVAMQIIISVVLDLFSPWLETPPINT